MDEMMTFPDTWEEFEKSYGFTDNEEVYTNGARLIPSFRVKQWLGHLPSVQPRKWIPAKERLPNKPSGDEYYWCSSHKADVPVCEYIVMIKGAELPTALFWDGCHWFDIDGNETLYPVVAWMPFPKPYEG